MIGRIVPRTALTQLQQEQMLGLMRQHFFGVTTPQFQADLEQKNWVILIEDEAGRLRGFSTLLHYTPQIDEGRLHAVYSGDTIVDAGARHDPTLARTWIAAVNRLRQESVADKVYWLLLTSGFRTYRFLPVFWRTFWPRHDAPTPEAAQQLLCALARERFGDQFQPQTGLVRFRHPQRLRPDLTVIPPGRTADPDVDFFLRRNPGFAAGDELVCLCELSETNLTAAGRRMIRRPV